VFVLHPGDDFAGYVVSEPLGHGGNAAVFRARRVRGDGDSEPVDVALKVLADNRRGPEEHGRLEREFEFAHRLHHRHIVTMYGSGPGWLAMQLIDGGAVTTLHTMDLRVDALGQIADALDYTHRQGIVHGDVKPSNILVSTDFGGPGAVLIDFGAARSISDGAGQRPTHIQATLPYSAPELLQGGPPSAATDEYALACTAVELITGAPPFTANTSMGLVDAQLHRLPPRVSRQVSWVPSAFDSILAKAMAKDPDLRYDSCTEFVTFITRVLR
jgi:eukaryotic-like serine/threonine-protein kinase